MRKLNATQWVLIFVLFTIFSAIIATNSYLKIPEDDIHHNWFKLFLFNIINWYLWTLIIPWVILIVNKYPLVSKFWVKHWTIHLLIALVILFVLGNARVIIGGYYWGYFDFSSLSKDQFIVSLSNRMLNDWLIYVLLIAIVSSYLSYLRRHESKLSLARVEIDNKELEKQLKEAQLLALKLQLSPHFLFNSLHTITSLVNSDRKKEAIDMTTGLGEFLRRALEYEKKPFVRLEKEIEFLDLYLAIEKKRFHDRIVIRQTINPETLDAIVPNLILQPIIENAIKHGISKKEDSGLIEVKTYLESQDFLHIEIFNDGAELARNWTMNTGLTNVEVRLEKIYRANYSFTLANCMNPIGVNCSLVLPLKTQVSNDT